MDTDAKCVVRLEPKKRKQLQLLVEVGRGTKSERQRARVMLKTGAGERSQRLKVAARSERSRRNVPAAGTTTAGEFKLVATYGENFSPSLS